MLFIKNNIPTHLLIGVRKSATSWIWKQFSDHPEIYVNPEKEIYFFNLNRKKGINWYRNQFKTNKEFIIDTTPDYFFSNFSKDLKNTLPKAKVFVCLRNPIERAYSHWKFAKYIGNTKKSFEEVWDLDWNKIRTSGLYDKHLESYLRYFNLKVMIFDDLIKNSLLFINEIYDYVGVSRHKSKFFQDKWMPGGVSEKRKEKEYETISEQKMTKKQYEFVRNYYTKSIKNTEKILKKELQWLD